MSGPGLESSLEPTVAELLQLCGEADSGWLDPAAVFSHVVGNMLNMMIFGLRYTREDPDWVWLQEVRAEGVRLISVSGAVNFFPVLRFWPSIARNIRFIK